MKNKIVKISFSHKKYNKILELAYVMGFDTIEEFLRCATLTQYDILTKKVIAISKK